MPSLSLPLWHERHASPPAPMTAAEMHARGWDEVDVVFVTGDAYVDHPSFAMAILHRVLEQAGFRVAMLSQPDWRSCEPWRQFGKPRLFFAISAGNMDSLINHYTANKKVRNDDAYSPGGRIGLRPDRATLPYCQRAREAFPGVPVIAGGVEASLRRLAHYDYWSDTVRRSILLDAKADLLGLWHGRAEHRRDRPALGGRTDGQGPSRSSRNGLPARRQRSRDAPRSRFGVRAALPKRPRGQRTSRQAFETIVLPSFEEVKADKAAFIKATRLDPSQYEPLQCRSARPVPRPAGRCRHPACVSAFGGGDGSHLRSAIYAPAAPVL